MIQAQGPIEVLIVENKTNNLCSLAKMLQHKEYITVSVLADEFDINAVISCQLIIIDQALGRFDSLGFYNSLKENPTLRNIPVLLLCDLDSLEALPLSLLSSNFDILLLPVRQAELLMRVSSLLSLGILLKQKEEKSLELDCCKQHRLDLHAQLIASEKSAALGRSVAGFSHELNTPLGLCVTAASYLADSSKQVSQSLSDKSLSTQAVQSYIDSVDETLDIILSSLNRSTEMVANFKLVAVDVSSEKKRSFVLHDYLKRVINSLTPALRKTKHCVEVVGDDLVIDTYPGALSQVITNIVMNAIIHAFEGREQGTVLIRVVHDGSNVHLNCSDNGKGMTSESLAKVFEAYYTTREGQGGSGLGTSIIYKLVTETLQGQISCSSELGVGTMFTITIPIYLAPEHASPANSN
jgi:signal transduction histidine kinase